MIHNGEVFGLFLLGALFGLLCCIVVMNLYVVTSPGRVDGWCTHACLPEMLVTTTKDECICTTTRVPLTIWKKPQ